MKERYVFSVSVSEIKPDEIEVLLSNFVRIWIALPNTARFDIGSELNMYLELPVKD